MPTLTHPLSILHPKEPLAQPVILQSKRVIPDSIECGGLIERQLLVVQEHIPLPAFDGPVQGVSETVVSNGCIAGVEGGYQ